MYYLQITNANLLLKKEKSKRNINLVPFTQTKDPKSVDDPMSAPRTT